MNDDDQPMDVTGILAQPRVALERIRALEQENAALRLEVDRLKAELAGYQSWASSVNEALNSGDGAYRP